MEELPTKQKILREALSLFAENGYEAVSVAQIANAVGIKAPSLYKHYSSKQDIFDAIVSEMARRYEKQAESMQMDGSQPERDTALFSAITEQKLIEMGKGLFLYFLHDEYTSKFRKMLTIEQYHSKELAALYAEQYIDAPLAYQSALFSRLSQAGVLKQEDPLMMALDFFAPMFLLLTLCDCSPQREEEALSMIERHIRQFNRLYRKDEE